MLLEQMNEKHTFFRGERTPILKDGSLMYVVMEGEKYGGEVGNRRGHFHPWQTFDLQHLSLRK